ncbi:hypothetical protein F4775DRAFT_556441, partial [Biscogniauxia sp. FL1348]
MQEVSTIYFLPLVSAERQPFHLSYSTSSRYVVSLSPPGPLKHNSVRLLCSLAGESGHGTGLFRASSSYAMPCKCIASNKSTNSYELTRTTYTYILIGTYLPTCYLAYLGTLDGQYYILTYIYPKICGSDRYMKGQIDVEIIKYLLLTDRLG